MLTFFNILLRNRCCIAGPRRANETSASDRFSFKRFTALNAYWATRLERFKQSPPLYTSQWAV